MQWIIRFHRKNFQMLPIDLLTTVIINYMFVINRVLYFKPQVWSISHWDVITFTCGVNKTRIKTLILGINHSISTSKLSVRYFPIVSICTEPDCGSISLIFLRNYDGKELFTILVHSICSVCLLNTQVLIIIK